MECLVCNMKGGLGFFPFFSFFLAWAFEPYFILYTLFLGARHKQR